MRATALAGAGIDLEPALELSSADALKHAVLSGGFATLSGRAVIAEVATGTLVSAPASGLRMSRALRAVRRARPALQGPARAFWLWLERTAAT